jgi:hypothetical protein
VVRLDGTLDDDWNQKLASERMSSSGRMKIASDGYILWFDQAQLAVLKPDGTLAFRLDDPALQNMWSAWRVTGGKVIVGYGQAGPATD